MTTTERLRLALADRYAITRKLGRNGDRLFFRQRDEVWEIHVASSGAVRSSARRIFSVPPWLSNLEIAPDGEHMFAIRGGLIYTDLIMKQGALK